MGQCSNCNYVGDTHFHHIVPKSRGGSDAPSNLIEVCPPCHRAIHDAEFGGDRGLIVHGISKRKLKDDDSNKWLSDHSDKIQDMLYDFAVYYDTNVVADMMRFGTLYSYDLRTMIHTGKHKVFKGDIPSMIHNFVKHHTTHRELLEIPYEC